MELICINCPRGCHLNVVNENGEIKVSGNFCKRGETYAINELTNPLRVVTTTIGIESKRYSRLPLITSKPIPKDKMMELVKSLKDLKVKAPVKIGDVVLYNVLGLNIDLLSSKSIDE